MSKPIRRGEFLNRRGMKALRMKLKEARSKEYLGGCWPYLAGQWEMLLRVLRRPKTQEAP